MAEGITRARRYVRSGRLDDAEAVCRAAVQADPQYGEARYALGAVLHMRGQNVDAILELKAATSADPGNTKYWLRLGQVLLADGDIDGAVEALENAVRIDPTPRSYHELGVAMVRGGRDSDAVDYFRRAIAAKPDFAKAHRNLGRALKRLGRYREARDAYRHAVELVPDDVSSILALGDAQRVMGEYGQAECNFESALHLEPENAAVYSSIGNLHLERSDLHAAERAFRRALALDPGHVVAADQLEVILHYLGRHEKTIDLCQQALAAEPENPAVRARLAMALWQQGDDDAAEEALAPCFPSKHEEASALYVLGRIRNGQDRREEALDANRRAMAQAPRHVYALAAEATFSAQKSARATSANGQFDKRVAVHIHAPHHYPIVRPVFDELVGKVDCILTPHVRELVDFNPHIVVVSDFQSAMLRARLPDALYVWTRHGLISKNCGRDAARMSDFACMVSEAGRNWQVENSGFPRRDFWLTGYVQMDPLFRDDDLSIDFPVPAGNAVVLYAPTWNAPLSSGEMLGHRLVELIRGKSEDVTIVIKPHPTTHVRHPELFNTWKRLAKTEPEVQLIEDMTANVIPYLKRADLLVSDASSVIFQYLALNRPIVLITNPERRRSTHFDPNGIEWRWRDVGDEVHDVEKLSIVIRGALDNPADRAKQRAHYRQKLFGNLTDGRAAKRIAQKIAEI